MWHLFVVSFAFGTCSPKCDTQWKGNKVCNLECMSKPCDFDDGDCLEDCFWSGCLKNSSDGTCDEPCNSNVCAFDFGDCGYCNEICTLEIFLDDKCDSECNTAECLYDNSNCVSYI